MPQPQHPGEQASAEKGDEAARKKDPHGVGSQNDEGDKPTAYPQIRPPRNGTGVSEGRLEAAAVPGAVRRPLPAAPVRVE